MFIYFFTFLKPKFNNINIHFFIIVIFFLYLYYLLILKLQKKYLIIILYSFYLGIPNFFLN